MLRIPGPVKRPLLPAWNAAHRWGRRAREHLGAIRHGRYERCTVCGRFGPMLYRPDVVPGRLAELWGLTPRHVAAVARRESCDCAWCGAKLRARRIARVLLELERSDAEVPPARSIAEWVRRPAVRALRVAEINRIDGLHEVLGTLPGLAYSDYEPGAAPGVVVEGTRSEDLTRLTYPDESFDLVLTSETLEHVPDLDAALAEIRRVLVPGGRHVFTVPMLPDVPATFPRATLAADGRIVPNGPLICHPGGDRGYPVFTEFGADLPGRLQAAGFEVTVYFGPPSDDDLAQVHVCRRPLAHAPG